MAALAPIAGEFTDFSVNRWGLTMENLSISSVVSEVGGSSTTEGRLAFRFSGSGRFQTPIPSEIA
jgi:hypothetical protein